jgi:hypothetical protein
VVSNFHTIRTSLVVHISTSDLVVLASIVHKKVLSRIVKGHTYWTFLYLCYILIITVLISSQILSKYLYCTPQLSVTMYMGAA